MLRKAQNSILPLTVLQAVQVGPGSSPAAATGAAVPSRKSFGDVGLTSISRTAAPADSSPPKPVPAAHVAMVPEVEQVHGVLGTMESAVMALILHEGLELEALAPTPSSCLAPSPSGPFSSHGPFTSPDPFAYPEEAHAGRPADWPEPPQATAAFGTQEIEDCRPSRGSAHTVFAVCQATDCPGLQHQPQSLLANVLIGSSSLGGRQAAGSHSYSRMSSTKSMAGRAGLPAVLAVPTHLLGGAGGLVVGGTASYIATAAFGSASNVVPPQPQQAQGSGLLDTTDWQLNRTSSFVFGAHSPTPSKEHASPHFIPFSPSQSPTTSLSHQAVMSIILSDSNRAQQPENAPSTTEPAPAAQPVTGNQAQSHSPLTPTNMTTQQHSSGPSKPVPNLVLEGMEGMAGCSSADMAPHTTRHANADGNGAPRPFAPSPMPAPAAIASTHTSADAHRPDEMIQAPSAEATAAAATTTITHTPAAGQLWVASQSCNSRPDPNNSCSSPTAGCSSLLAAIPALTSPTSPSAGAAAHWFHRTASGFHRTASGLQCTASGFHRTASGLQCNASGFQRTASGLQCTAAGKRAGPGAALLRFASGCDAHNLAAGPAGAVGAGGSTTNGPFQAASSRLSTPQLSFGMLSAGRALSPARLAHSSSFPTVPPAPDCEPGKGLGKGMDRRPEPEAWGSPCVEPVTFPDLASLTPGGVALRTSHTLVAVSGSGCSLLQPPEPASTQTTRRTPAAAPKNPLQQDAAAVATNCPMSSRPDGQEEGAGKPASDGKQGLSHGVVVLSRQGEGKGTPLVTADSEAGGAFGATGRAMMYKNEPQGYRPTPSAATPPTTPPSPPLLSGLAPLAVTASAVAAVAAPPAPVYQDVELLLHQAYTSWTFDSFELDAATDGHPLSCLGYFLLQATGLVKSFKLEALKLARFLRAVEASYRDNPYHNKIHAADVLQTLHVLVTAGGLAGRHITPLQHLAAYLAAIVHDLEHVGLNNDFLVNTQVCGSCAWLL